MQGAYPKFFRGLSGKHQENAYFAFFTSGSFEAPLIFAKKLRGSPPARYITLLACPFRHVNYFFIDHLYRKTLMVLHQTISNFGSDILIFKTYTKTSIETGDAAE